MIRKKEPATWAGQRGKTKPTVKAGVYHMKDKKAFQNELVASALSALKHSFSVIPTNEDKKAIISWGEYQQNRMKSEVVDGHFQRAESLAIIAGKISGNLELIDFDKADLFKLFIEDLEQKEPGLSAKLCQRKTPNGYHIFYRCHDAVAGNQKLAIEAIEVDGAGEHPCSWRGGKGYQAKQINGKYYIQPCSIETRGEGGYFLHAPSTGYKVLINDLADCPVLSASEVRSIHTIARMFDRNIKPDKQQSKLDHGDDTRPGDVFNQRHKSNDILIDNGWKVSKKTTAGMGYTRPGKNGGVSGVLLENGNFYVWSTSVSPLDAEQSYTPFALFVHLKFNGDYKAAARDLSAKGYGSQTEKSKSAPNENNDKEKQPKISQLIIDTVIQNATLFHDADDTPYAQFDNNGHFELWPLESKQFQRWIGQAMYKKYQLAPNKNSLSDAVNVLAGQAIYDGQEIDIHIRVAAVDGNYFLDLCNDDWQVIKIEPGKWQVADGEDCGIYFRRTSTMRPLPMPGNHSFEKLPALLSRHLNMTEQHLRLTIAYLIECWMPDTEYPVMEITGSPGSGKSTAQEMVRFCVDPNRVNLRAAPKTTDDIFVSAINNHLVSYNNLSRISSGQSDALCSLSTGGGHAGRKFFTNTDETATDVKKPVVLNGIGHLAKMPDLIDRLLKICLQPITSTENKPKKLVMDNFNKDLPAILGALLNLFSKILEILPTVKLDQLPRMADFAILCQAITQIYKWDNSLLSAYYENRSLSFEDSLESSPAIMAVMKVVNYEGAYNGTIGGLYNIIESHKKEHDSWIKTARGLGEKLRLHTPALLAMEIKVDFDPIRHNDGFHVNLTKMRDTDRKQHSQHTRHTQNTNHSEPIREGREGREGITPSVSRMMKEDVEIF